MSNIKKKIEKLMKETGACWAYRNDKHESNHSNGKRVWHIHPNSQTPYQDNIRMFSTLADVHEFLQDLLLAQDRDRLFMEELEKELAKES